jgi:hydrogenase maturation protein HypF
LAEEPPDLLKGVDEASSRKVSKLLEVGTACVSSTGAGRWFDAIASLCDVRNRISYEGQAAAELEALATPGPAMPYEISFVEGAQGEPFIIDMRCIVRAVARDLRSGTARELVAARFHETLATAIVASCRRARAAGGPAVVVLTGGCFQNRKLSERAIELLGQEGFEVLIHRRVPPNDGGLAYGQAVVVSSRLAEAS